MSHFDQPVSRYMTTGVAAVTADSSLSEVARCLAERRISGVPVIRSAGTIAGVVTRSDLLHAGQFEAVERGGARALRLPERRAIELVTRPPHVCSPETTLRDAARELVRHRIHRLFVVEDDRPVGVISTLDLVAAVRDARVEVPIGELMTSPVLTIAATASLEAAVGELDRAHVTGLVVVDERWPIGVFAQAEAMAARDLPGTTRIEDIHDPAVICMPARTRAYVAATQAAHLDVRRVVACEQQEAVGVVSGLDFARLVAA